MKALVFLNSHQTRGSNPKDHMGFLGQQNPRNRAVIFLNPNLLVIYPISISGRNSLQILGALVTRKALPEMRNL